MYELYPHQQDAVAAFAAAVTGGCRRVAAQMPTGSGKTIVIAELVRRELERGGRVVVVAPRREIVFQIAETIREHTQVTCGIEMQGCPASSGQAVIVASNCSLGRPRSPRLRRAFAPEVTALIFDEAHRAPTSNVTWRTIAETAGIIAPQGREYHPTGRGPLLYGLSATLQRADNNSLGSMFDACCYTIDLQTLVEQGFLAKPLIGTPVRTNVTLDCQPHGEDLLDRDLERLFLATPQRNAAAVEVYRTLYADRQFIAFLPGVTTAHQLAQMFLYAGYPVACIDANTPHRQRAQLLRAFRAGRLVGLTNCGTLTEGTDLPMASLCLMMRPTMSAPLYTQMAGRVLRSWSAVRQNIAQQGKAEPSYWRGAALDLRGTKEDAVIVDFVDNSHLPLQSAPCLLGGEANQLAIHLNGIDGPSPPPPPIVAPPKDLGITERTIDQRPQRQRRQRHDLPVEVGIWKLLDHRRDLYALRLPDDQGYITVQWCSPWGGFDIRHPLNRDEEALNVDAKERAIATAGELACQLYGLPQLPALPPYV